MYYIHLQYIHHIITIYSICYISNIYAIRYIIIEETWYSTGLPSTPYRAEDDIYFDPSAFTS